MTWAFREGDKVRLKEGRHRVEFEVMHVGKDVTTLSGYMTKGMLMRLIDAPDGMLLDGLSGKFWTTALKDYEVVRDGEPPA